MTKEELRKSLDFVNDERERLQNRAEKLEKQINKTYNIIQKFKETYIICFDKELWGFVKRLEKALKGCDEE